MPSFNTPFLNKLAPKEKKYFEKEDSSERGGGRFAVQVSPNGLKQFYLLYFIEGKLKKMSLSSYSADNGKNSLEQARGEFRKYSEQLKKGLDPRVVKTGADEERKIQQRQKEERLRRERAQGSFAQLLDAYLANLKQNRSKKHFDNVTKAFALKDIDLLLPLKANKVTTPDVLLVLRAIAERGSLSMADKVRLYFSAAFNYGIRMENGVSSIQNTIEFNLSINPVAAIPVVVVVVGANNVRDRYLSEDEVKVVWDYIGHSNMHSSTKLAIKFFLATGQRIEQCCLMEWSEIKGGLWECPATKMKKGEPHIVPLNEIAVDILRQAEKISDYVFYGSDTTLPLDPDSPNQAINRRLAKMGIENFQAKDLRTTFKTLSGKAGLTKEIRDKLQHHADSDVSAKHYDRYDYLKEKEAAMVTWGKYLQRIIDGEVMVGNVIQFKKIAVNE